MADRGWDTSLNGIKVKSDGAFGVVNLRSPRLDDWHDTYTFVQLRFEFMDGRARQLGGEPQLLDVGTGAADVGVFRTFVTFYECASTPTSSSGCGRHACSVLRSNLARQYRHGCRQQP